MHNENKHKLVCKRYSYIMNMRTWCLCHTRVPRVTRIGVESPSSPIRVPIESRSPSGWPSRSTGIMGYIHSPSCHHQLPDLDSNGTRSRLDPYPGHTRDPGVTLSGQYHSNSSTFWADTTMVSPTQKACPRKLSKGRYDSKNGIK